MRKTIYCQGRIIHYDRIKVELYTMKG